MDVAGDSRKYHTIFSYGLTLVGCVLGHWPGMESEAARQCIPGAPLGVHGFPRNTYSNLVCGVASIMVSGNKLNDGAVRGGYLVQKIHSNIR